MSTALLQVQQLSCERAGRAVFQPLSFALAAGQAMHVLGDNGAGKTTLLRALAGLTPLSQGWVQWRGLDSAQHRSAFHAELLYLGHTLGLKDDLTAMENVQCNAAMAGQRLGRADALHALDSQGLRSRAQLPLRVLSQGQKRRVALARLQSATACLWLLDEPWVALDTNAVQALQQLVQAHLARGGVVVFTSHQKVALGPNMQTLSLQP